MLKLIGYLLYNKPSLNNLWTFFSWVSDVICGAGSVLEETRSSNRPEALEVGIVRFLLSYVVSIFIYNKNIHFKIHFTACVLIRAYSWKIQGTENSRTTATPAHPYEDQVFGREIPNSFLETLEFFILSPLVMWFFKLGRSCWRGWWRWCACCGPPTTWPSRRRKHGRSGSGWSIRPPRPA